MTDEVLAEAPEECALDVVLRRIRRCSDFPSMSSSMEAVCQLTDSNDGDAARLSVMIQRDFALTNKLIRVANAAHYSSGYSGPINTISRAVVVLGFDAVRSLALSLMLFERLEDQAHAAALKDEILRANLSGMMARGLGARLAGGQEEYFLCGVFHRLGRLLAHFYIRDEALAVDKLVSLGALTEAAAARQVMGICYRELGIGIARSWGFPEPILDSMQAQPATMSVRSAEERLRLVSNVSESLCLHVERSGGDVRADRLLQVMGRFAGVFKLADKDLSEIAKNAMSSAVEIADILDIDLDQSALGQAISSQDPTTFAKAMGDEDSGTESPGTEADPESILQAGIRVCTEALVAGDGGPRTLSIVVDCLFRATASEQVILALGSASGSQFKGRFDASAKNTPDAAKFCIEQGGTDLFGLILDRGSDLLVKDAHDPKIVSRCPPWFRACFGDHQSFLLMPLSDNGQAVGMIYAGSRTLGGIRATESMRSLIQTLRNQAILAIRAAPN